MCFNQRFHIQNFQLAASDAENERYAAELSQLLATVQKKQDEILAGK